LAVSQTIQVGVYQNPPLTIIDENGNVSGFFADIAEEIAMEEGWQLQYKEYDFSECLLALERGEIDLMFPLAHSDHRDSLFIFYNTNVISNWGKLYKNTDDDFHYTSMDQLKGKRIAVLKSDYFYANGENGLHDLLEELNIQAEIVELESYKQVIEYVTTKKVDVGLVSRYYGIMETDNKGVVKTPINIAYVSLRFAFSRNLRNSVLAEKLDDKLLQLINNRSSVYYASQKKYLSFESQPFIPLWLWRALGIVLLAIVVLIVFVILLQYQVKKKTIDLKETNRMLSNSERQARLAVQTIEASQDIGFWFQQNQPFIRVNQAAILLTGYSKEELLEMRARDLLATDTNEDYYKSLQEGSWNGHLRLEETFRTKSGETFPVELSLDEFRLDGQIYICGFARNITERVKAEHQLIERNKELNCLYTISKLIADRNNSVEDILRQALKAIPVAWQYPDVTSASIRYHEKIYYSEKYVECSWQLKTPINSAGKEVGEIVVGYSESMPEEDQGPFLKEEVDLINAIGKEIGNMLDSRDAERRIIATILSTEDIERSRISKELHDSVGQTLSAISINLDALSKVESLSSKEKVKLRNIEKLVKNAIAESRSVSHNLMPPVLTDLGYTYAIENLLDSIELASETKFSFHSNESKIQVPKEIEFTLFRITQEAINNIIKYSSASEATIQYLVFDDLLSLSIEDNGKGFNLEKVNKKHNFGLNSMRSRASSIGAEFTIDTAPERGTGIHLSLPLT